VRSETWMVFAGRQTRRGVLMTKACTHGRERRGEKQLPQRSLDPPRDVGRGYRFDTCQLPPQLL
jgi:hypothetical protein